MLLDPCGADFVVAEWTQRNLALVSPGLDERFVAVGRRFRLVRGYPEGEERKPSYRFEEVAP